MSGTPPIPVIPLEVTAKIRKNWLSGASNSEIIMRKPPHLRDFSVKRQWLGGRRVGSAWFTALSTSFPRGEAFFIESLRANKQALPPELAQDVARFIAQEASHAREHRRFNRMMARTGYDLAPIDARLAQYIAETTHPSNFVNLLASAALEHLTAIMAHDLLARGLMDQANPKIAALWRWHAAEEIEHKAVCFDVWMHVASGLSPWRRWKIRSLVMLKISISFLRERGRDTCELLVQDGYSPAHARASLRRYLFGRRGLLWALLGPWLRWFVPGFHPWHHDDHALISQALGADGADAGRPHQPSAP